MNRAPVFGSRNMIRPGQGMALALGLRSCSAVSGQCRRTGFRAGSAGLELSCPVPKMDLSIRAGSRSTTSAWAARRIPCVVMIHGFPDFWYSWRAQMPELAKHFHVVAIDQRGYNLSGQPEGVENYTTDKLVGDVVAVVKHFGTGKAVIVGHDWGGLVAWTFAMTHPELTDRLVVLNLPHPRGLLRELATNPQQQKNSQYARNFQKPDAAKHVSVEFLTGWVKDPEARKVYLAAFKRSSLEGMLNYYKANYPRIPDDAAKNDATPSRPCPTFPPSSARCS